MTNTIPFLIANLEKLIIIISNTLSINAGSNISQISEKPKRITEKTKLDLFLALLRHCYLPVTFSEKFGITSDVLFAHNRSRN